MPLQKWSAQSYGYLRNELVNTQDTGNVSKFRLRKSSNCHLLQKCFTTAAWLSQYMEIWTAGSMTVESILL